MFLYRSITVFCLSSVSIVHISCVSQGRRKIEVLVGVSLCHLMFSPWALGDRFPLLLQISKRGRGLQKDNVTSKAISPQDAIKINLLKLTRQMVTDFGTEEKNTSISGVILLLPFQCVSRNICCFNPCYLWIYTGAVCKHKSEAENLNAWQHFGIFFPMRRHRGHWIMSFNAEYLKKGKVKVLHLGRNNPCMNICWGLLSSKWAWQKRTWAGAWWTSDWTQTIMFPCHKQG